MKNRKGLSSVVGTVFAIIALATVITYVTFSMNTLERFNQEVMVKNTEIIDQTKEEFNVVKAAIPNSKFNITVQNTGELPINITRLWISNKTDPSWGTAKYDVNIPISPGKVATNIGQNIALTALSTKAYEIKLATERGNADEIAINSPSQEQLYLQMHVLPEAVATEFTTTVLFSVTNNMSNNNMLLNLAPDPTDGTNSIGVSTNCATTCSATFVSGPSPTSYPSLKQGDTATFKWIYEVQGSPGDTATFTASLNNGIATNTATTVATVTEIVSALEAGSAIESLGLKTPTGTDDVLYLHDETYFTPSSSYQLSTATPDIGGDWIDVDNSDPSWFTKNGTETITIPSGIWRASLRYVNEYLPDSLVLTGSNQVDMIFHLNSNIDLEPDSTNNTPDLNRCNGSTAPTFNANGGPHSDGYYDFDGTNDCIDSNFDVESHSDIQDEPDSTALWFRAPTTETNNRQIMIRFDSNNTGYTSDLYEISLGDGTAGNKRKVVFEYETDSGGAARTKCVSDNRLDNNIWHHVVAVRQSDDDCRLYIDNVMEDEVTTSYSSNSVDALDQFHIGYNGAGDYFDGDIADIIHWNDKFLSGTEVTTLYNTNFGNASARIDFIIEKTNSDGALLQNIVTSTNYPMPFKDSLDAFSTSYSSFADSVWGQANYTTASLPSVTVSPGQRVNFTMVWKSGLDMILWHDDQTMTTPKSSFIQLPLPNATFASYFTFSKTNQLSVYVYNVGPYGSWLVYQGTRAVFENATSARSWAGIICAVNSTDISPPSDACSSGSNSGFVVSEHRDSIFIPVNKTGVAYFWDIQDRPDANQGGGTEIPDGEYNMYVFIDGYDEKGQKFLRYLSLGKVKVIP